MLQGKKVDVIVTGIQQTDSPTIYIVEMKIADVPKSFKFQVRTPHLMSVGTERAFDDIFWGTRGHGAREIASLVVKYHKGEAIDFPVALQIIDYKQPKPSP